MSKPESLGYERMFWKTNTSSISHQHCVACGESFDTFTELYSHRELWHGTPIRKLSGITTIGELPSEHKTSKSASPTEVKEGETGV